MLPIFLALLKTSHLASLVLLLIETQARPASSGVLPRYLSPFDYDLVEEQSMRTATLPTPTFIVHHRDYTLDTTLRSTGAGRTVSSIVTSPTGSLNGVAVLSSTSQSPSETASFSTPTSFNSSVTSVSTKSTSLVSTEPSSSNKSSGIDAYHAYLGDGSIADGWPAKSQWASFDYLWSHNRPSIMTSCALWNVPNNSNEETNTLKAAIQSLAKDTGVDERFILAIVMQESTGCVRVITTKYSHSNPGLMQSYSGNGTCNTNSAALGNSSTGVVQMPCPTSEIYQMISDGTNGTFYIGDRGGDGLRQIIQSQTNDSAQAYYRTAKIYNGGSIANATALQSGCCTPSYASDIANRLTGWSNAPRNFPG